MKDEEKGQREESMQREKSNEDKQMEKVGGYLKYIQWEICIKGNLDFASHSK